MPTAISSTLKAATRRPDESLNVLTFATHERFQQMFGLTKHRYFFYRGASVKEWDSRFASLPNNTSQLSGVNGPHQIPPYLDIDVILSQSKFGQYAVAKMLSHAWQVPLISLEHTLPHPSWSETTTETFRNQRGHINVFLSDYSRNAWGWNEDFTIVGPGIDTEIFVPEWTMPKQRAILSVVNDWINRDWACGFYLWKNVTKDIPVMVLGDTPGLSKPAKTTQELTAAYQQNQVFLNTSLISTCPFTLLEAMASGCAVVSTATTMIPQIIKDGVNGFCSNEPATIRYRCQQLLDNPELCTKLGREARRTIEDKFSFKRMAGDWDGVLRSAANIVVTGE